MPSFEKLVELLKIKTPHAVGLFVVCSALLLAPDRFPTSIGLLEYRQQGKPYFAAVLLSNVLLIAVQGKLSD